MTSSIQANSACITAINPHIRVFHCRTEVTKQIADLIAGIRGIDHAFVHNRYSVWVAKGEAFSWDEVMLGIREILAGADLEGMATV